MTKIIEMGGYGVISSTGNIAPRYFTEMTRVALEAKKREGDFTQAHSMQKYILPLKDAVFCAKNPIPLAHMFDTYLRLPMCRLDRIQPTIDKALAMYTSKELGIDVRKYKN